MAPKDVEYLEIAHQRSIEKKSHVSFPQLKYPSLRDSGPKDPVQWLAGKALDDGAEGLWRVRDKIYDLEKFIDKHPGGAEWIELTKGTDVTEAFETHHFSSSVETILEKYYVRDTTVPRNSPFTFHEDGFYKTLKRAVKEELTKIKQKELSVYSNMIMDGLFATCLISSVLSLWLKNTIFAWPLYLVAALSLAWTCVASHNYIHRKNNWRMHLFSMTLWSYRDFRISHVLSHHLYPNTLMDLEISAFEPVVFWMPRNKPLYAAIGIVIEFLIFPFGFLQNGIKKFLLNFFRQGYFRKYYRWMDLIGLVHPLVMWLATNSSVSEVIIQWLWINCTASLIFFTIGSNAAHHHPDIFKDGDQVPQEQIDWGLHEVETLMDRTDISGSLFKVMTFFGDHALHHLFPTLDHAVLPRLYPIFLKHCIDYKANFRMTSSADLFIGQILMCFKSQPTLLEDRAAPNVEKNISDYVKQFLPK